MVVFFLLGHRYRHVIHRKIEPRGFVVKVMAHRNQSTIRIQFRCSFPIAIQVRRSTVRLANERS